MSDKDEYIEEAKQRKEKVDRLKEKYDWSEGIPEDLDGDLKTKLKKIEKEEEDVNWEEILDSYYKVYDVMHGITEELENPLRFEDIIDEEFVEEHTSFDSSDEFFEEFKVVADDGFLMKVKKLVGMEDDLDDFAVKNTSFDSFEGMTEEAVREHFKDKDLDNLTSLD